LHPQSYKKVDTIDKHTPAKNDVSKVVGSQTLPSCCQSAAVSQVCLNALFYCVSMIEKTIEIFFTMPPRQGSNSNLAQRKADKVLQAASFLPGLIRSNDFLKDIPKHWQDVSTLSCAVTLHSADAAVLRQLALHSDLPRQLCSCLAGTLQHLAAAGGSVGAQDPALALLTQIADPLLELFTPLTHAALGDSAAAASAKLASVAKEYGAYTSYL
jgi:hypothetical protein